MYHFLLVFILFFSVLSLTNGDFLIEGLRNIQKRSIEQPGHGIEVYSIDISSKVVTRFAHNVITSRAINKANESKEAFFDVDLPKSAFITNFSMIIDGVTYAGVIKEKKVAMKYYQHAVSRGQTAGLVRASGRKTEKFTVSVNVASHSNVTFELIYEEMLRRQFGKYEMVIKVQPKTIVKNFQIEVDLHEPQGISSLDAQASFITNDLLPAITKSFSGEKGHVSFKPTINQQRACVNCSTTLLDGDFTVTYNVNTESPGNIQIVNGYFVHFFAPTKLTAVPKNVIYVIDRSGSMSGRKIQQTIESLLTILSETAEHDNINFILFDHMVDVWNDSLVKATPENLKEAKDFVSKIKPGGYTNINDPLLQAIQLLNKARGSNQIPERSVSLIILLTDGEANVGERRPEMIQRNVREANRGMYNIYCLGYGHGVDYAFLEKMALENSGVARRIYEDSDAALQLQGFYKEIANPTLVNIEMQYPENAIAGLTQSNFRQFYDGNEIVVAGRLTDNDLNSFTVNVTAEAADESLKYSENVTLQDKGGVQKQQEYIFGDFTERLWAYLTIQQLLERRISTRSPAENLNLTEQALNLSLKFQFVTPLTSMVVTKPKEKKKKTETLVADKFVDGQGSSHSAAPSGALGYHHQSSAPPRNWVDSDPHFVINVSNKKDALCFNIQEEPGVVLNLIEDKALGIAVNGELIGNKKTDDNVVSNGTYFGKLGIVNREIRLKIEVTTENITIVKSNQRESFTWGEVTSIMKEGFYLEINEDKRVTISFGEGATFVIILHEVWKDDPLHRDFLGFYTLDDHKFSAGVHGLLGQFFHGIDYEISNVHETGNSEKPDATMKVKNKLLTVTRGVQNDYREDPRNGSKVPCWFVHYNGEGLIDGSHTDYIVPDIFSIA